VPEPAQARLQAPGPTLANSPPPAELRDLAALMNGGRFAEVASRAGGLVRQYPEHGQLWKIRGAALVQQRQPAVIELQRAAQLLPEDPETHYLLGNATQDGGEPAAAAAAYRRAIQLRPGFAEAHDALGSTLQDLGRHEESLASFRNALRLKPEMAEAHSNLGNSLLALGKPDEALASYQKAIQLRPDFVEAHASLANAWIKIGRRDDAVASYRRALHLNPTMADAQIALAGALRDSGELDQSLAAYQRALELRPDLAELHNKLGNLQMQIGHPGKAERCYRRAIELAPDQPAVYGNLGNALRDLGRLDEAVACFRRALEIQPTVPEIYNNLGNALLDLTQLTEAESSYRQALVLKPEYATAFVGLSMTLRKMGRSDEAEDSCRRAVELSPGNTDALTFMAEFLADRGDFAGAERLFRQAISSDPELPVAWAGIPRYRKMSSADADWLAAAKRLIGKGLPVRHEISLRFSIGKYYDDVQDYEQAFAHYRRANDLVRQYGLKYDRQRLSQLVDRKIALYDSMWLDRERSGAATSQRPVFVIGMPRSGTTLIEQILASHPAGFGAGELSYWNTVAANYEPSVSAANANPGALSTYGEGYLGLLQRLAPDALRVVDKMPANFMNLGLMHAALPEARIIHIRRHPFDTCLSIYFQNFSTALPYANDLEDLAHYYSEYLRMIAHWRAVLPADRLLEIQYESLIDEPEVWSRRLVEFIGLPWDPRCLEFHTISRSVTTASKWQVRQKISKSSVDRWRNYEQHIGPLRTLANLRASQR
jgi:tetratricopeptide (TPR) repeat protein